MKEFLNEFMDSHKNDDMDVLKKDIIIFKKTLNIITTLKKEIFKPKGNLNLGILDAIFVGTYNNLKNKNNFQQDKYSTCIENIVNSSDFKKFIETGKTHHTLQMKNRIEYAINELSKIYE